MGTRRLFLILAVAAVALTALPATASAAMRTGKGKTSQRKSALVWVRGDNSVALVKLAYRASCRAPGYRSTGVMSFRDNQRKPFVRDGARFSDGGKLTQRSRGEKVVGNTAMAGGPSADGGWEGTFRLQLRYYRNGRLTDFCKTGVITWKVGPPA